MALDNAQFISELSITDPPGTDAVAEGDDHIRTVKRATQQSFPNVDAAVPQTAAQMGQMAIKNEVNVFTQINSFAPDQLFNEAIHVRKQANNNIADIRYQDAAGINRWIVRFDSDQATLDDDWKVQRRDSLGAFVDDPLTISADTGDVSLVNLNNVVKGADELIAGWNFKDSAGTTRWAVRIGLSSAAQPLEINRFTGAGALQSTPIRFDRDSGQILASSGTAALPQYSFQSSPTMGMYRLAAGIIGFAPAGAERFRIATSSASFIAPNMRVTVSDTSAGSGKFECGVLSDNSGFVQGRTGSGDVSWLMRSDANGQSFVGGFASGNKFGIRTTTPLRTLHVAGEGATAMRVTGLPTSNVGLSSGDIFISSGFLAIV